jgi:hypothetical protein
MSSFFLCVLCLLSETVEYFFGPPVTCHFWRGDTEILRSADNERCVSQFIASMPKAAEIALRQGGEEVEEELAPAFKRFWEVRLPLSDRVFPREWIVCYWESNRAKLEQKAAVPGGLSPRSERLRQYIPRPRRASAVAAESKCSAIAAAACRVKANSPSTKSPSTHTMKLKSPTLSTTTKTPKKSPSAVETPQSSRPKREVASKYLGD